MKAVYMPLRSFMVVGFLIYIYKIMAQIEYECIAMPYKSLMEGVTCPPWIQSPSSMVK